MCACRNTIPLQSFRTQRAPAVSSSPYMHNATHMYNNILYQSTNTVITAVIPCQAHQQLVETIVFDHLLIMAMLLTIAQCLQRMLSTLITSWLLLHTLLSPVAPAHMHFHSVMDKAAVSNAINTAANFDPVSDYMCKKDCLLAISGYH
jgi:hypothetical protein